MKPRRKPGQAPTHLPPMPASCRVALSCLLVAFVSSAGAQGTAQRTSAGNALTTAIDNLLGAKEAPSAGPSSSTKPAANRAPAKPVPLTPAEQLEIKRYRALLAKGTVTGEDLLDTIKTLRRDLITARNTQTSAQLALALGQSTHALTSSQDINWDSLLNLGSNLIEERIKSSINEFAFKTLDDYLQTLLDNPRSTLAEQTVVVPKPDGLSNTQIKRNVTLAALIVIAKVSNEVLTKAEADFKSLNVDYKTLLEQREAATQLMIASIDQRLASATGSAGKSAADTDLSGRLSPQDLAFIDNTLTHMTLREFAQDMAAQNLALEYLRTKDPVAFKNYRTLADDVVRRTRAYIRTVSGLAAFGAMSMTFSHEMSMVADENSLDSVMKTTPLAAKFLNAALPLGKKAVEVSAKGVVLPELSTAKKSIGLGIKIPSRDLFTVSQNEKTKSVSDAPEVFQYIGEVHMAEPFANHLFSGEPVGWLRRIYMCDAGQAGQMMDAAVPQDERGRFAREYLQWTDAPRIDHFNFTNAFDRPGASKREADLAEAVLDRDQRKRASSPPVASVQNAVARNFGAWNNQQLLQMIFHNRESGAAYAALEFDGLVIKPIPSAEAIYAYESRVDSCQKAAARPVASNITRATTPAR